MICEAILHFDPLRTQIKTEIIDQNDIHRVKYIESDEIMRMIRQHSYTPPMHSGLLPPNCIALTVHREQWNVTLASDFDHCEVSYYKTRYEDFPVPRLYPEFCVNPVSGVKQSKIFTRRHCNSRPSL